METPEHCIDVLRTIRRTIGASEFVGVFNYGGMPLEERSAIRRYSPPECCG